MVSTGAMYTIGSGLTVHYPHAERNYRKRVGRCERVEERNLNVKKIEIKAEGREFLQQA